MDFKKSLNRKKTFNTNCQILILFSVSDVSSIPKLGPCYGVGAGPQMISSEELWVTAQHFGWTDILSGSIRIQVSLSRTENLKSGTQDPQRSTTPYRGSP